mmetsp:Transcript_15023/g.44250  ORF Transcript_15023/g.44250 Transcript_15023/m.44250 type:complete len:441 (+) Transcript_15023:201-1523(+)
MAAEQIQTRTAAKMPGARRATLLPTLLATAALCLAGAVGATSRGLPVGPSSEAACSCMLVYEPVCAGGKDFGSRCLANCAGFENGDIVDGKCGAEAVPGAAGDTELEDTCMCTMEWDPVCAGGKTFGNRCGAECAGVPAEDISPGECPPGPAGEAKQDEGDTDDDVCMCTTEWDPVCAGGKTFGNRCEAECAGVPAEDVAPGECPSVNASSSSECSCPKDYRPVCATEANVTFDNACLAACANYTRDELTSGPCGAPFDDDNATDTGSDGGDDDEGCFCPAIYHPVCDEATGTTYENMCFAMCSLRWDANTDASAWTPGECPAASKVEACETGCSDAEDPVCVLYQHDVGDMDAQAGLYAKLVSSVNFSNMCVAACHSGRAPVLGLYRGQCDAGADEACAVTADGDASTVCHMRRDDVAEYPSACYARQLANATADELSW